MELPSRTSSRSNRPASFATRLPPLYAVGLHVRPRLVFGKLRMRLVGFFPILTVFGEKSPVLDSASLQLNNRCLLLLVARPDLLTNNAFFRFLLRFVQVSHFRIDRV